MEWKFKGMKEKLFGTMIFDNRFVISEVKIQFMKQKKNDLWNEHKNTKNLLAAHLKMNKNFVLNYIHKILFYLFFKEYVSYNIGKEKETYMHNV